MMADILRPTERIAADKSGHLKRIEEITSLIDTEDAKIAIQKYEELCEAISRGDVDKADVPASLHRSIGYSYLKISDFNKAIVEFESYLRIHPDSDDVRFSLASCYIDIYDPVKSISHYEILNKSKIKDSAVINNLGNSYLVKYDLTGKSSDLKTAVELFEESYELDTGDSMHACNLAYSLFELYSVDQKKQHLIRGQEIIKSVEFKSSNEHTIAYIAYAKTREFEATGDEVTIDEAITLWESIYKERSWEAAHFINYSESLILKSKISKSTEFLVKAIEMLKIVIDEEPKSSYANYNLACIYALRKEKEEMLKHLSIVIKISPARKSQAIREEYFKSYWKDDDFKKLTKEDDDNYTEKA